MGAQLPDLPFDIASVIILDALGPAAAALLGHWGLHGVAIGALYRFVRVSGAACLLKLERTFVTDGPDKALLVQGFDFVHQGCRLAVGTERALGAVLTLLTRLSWFGFDHADGDISDYHSWCRILPRLGSSARRVTMRLHLTLRSVRIFASTPRKMRLTDRRLFILCSLFLYVQYDAAFARPFYPMFVDHAHSDPGRLLQALPHIELFTIVCCGSFSNRSTSPEALDMDRDYFISRFGCEGTNLRSGLTRIRFETDDPDVYSLEAKHLLLTKEARDVGPMRLYQIVRQNLRYEWVREGSGMPWVFVSDPTSDYLEFPLLGGDLFYSFQFLTMFVRRR